MSANATILEKMSTLIPNECKEQCTPFIQSISSCFEKTGGNFGMSMELATGEIKPSGNSIGVYLCTCNSNVKSTNKDNGCGECMKKTPFSIIPEKYESFCGV